MPAAPAMPAASTFVTMPPLPTADPVPPIVTASRSAVVGDQRHPARPGPRRRAVVERVDVGQQHQPVGPHDVGDERGEAVVVAEADLVGGHRVVLVDDRHDAELEQPLERAARVGVVGAAGDVVGGEQHLAHGEPVGRERRLVRRHERALADARGGLLRGEVGRAPGQAQRADAGRDRTGGHEHHLATRAAPRGQHVDQRTERAHVEVPTVTARQRRGADLDDEALPLPHGTTQARGGPRHPAQSLSPRRARWPSGRRGALPPARREPPSGRPCARGSRRAWRHGSCGPRSRAARRCRGDR